MECIRAHRCFGGSQQVWRHDSAATGTPMEFAIFLPFDPPDGRRRPVLFWLSGLTCTWANFTEKAGAQCHAAAHGLIIVCPDTSPRGTGLPGEHESYDFGSGAGFYVDAAVEPWSRHYRMFSYVTEELPALIERHFPADVERRGICGHSMGGHGALTIALKQPERWRSVSAVAPIVAPSRVPWGRKAFTGYFGPEEAALRAHDACALAARSSWRRPILIDQGGADEFLHTQLRPELFEAACAEAGIPLELRRHDGYDHSYYFIATFIADHIAHHRRALTG
ncbi:MAG TPA: S-formylglutathione hydrolase [Rhodospirillales bacterium]|nr:S-formylglutathione hydrolase [Rhodospirillales bacterium]